MPATVELTKKHFALLRQYWHAGRNGMTSAGSGLALDLTVAGYLEPKETGGSLALRITTAGIEELQAELGREKDRRRPHHDLASRLSHWLRKQGRITWENIELLVPRAEGGKQAVRPDVSSLAATYDEKRINPCIYEVKVIRSNERTARSDGNEKSTSMARPSRLKSSITLPRDAGSSGGKPHTSERKPGSRRSENASHL